MQNNGSDCGSVGWAVASETRGPWFESSHHQNLCWLFTVNCIEKTIIKEKEAGNCPFKNNAEFNSSLSAKSATTREPWSNGYGRRLMFRRLWVRIPAPYTGWTFFTYKCRKNWNDGCLKWPKINDKRGRGWPILKKLKKHYQTKSLIIALGSRLPPFLQDVRRHVKILPIKYLSGKYFFQSFFRKLKTQTS